MHRVDRVLLALEPIARHGREHDLYEAVGPSEWLPVRHQRRGIRPEIGPQQSGFRLDTVRLDANLVAETDLGRSDILIRLFETGAGLVEHPAVVVATQPT